ncbi:cupredoxin domain-containing protein, partial [Kingella kingae]|nr:cupredoxin domain-containing protein [Kingella kingae]
ADKPAEPAQPASGATSGATAAAGGAVQVAINDTACEPMELTVPSGQVEFQIQNNSSRKLEWEILNGVMVVDERE